MERDSARGPIQPGLKILARVCSNRARIFSPGKRARKSENHWCNRNVISARAEQWAWTCVVILFISARAEVRHVIRPLLSDEMFFAGLLTINMYWTCFLQRTCISGCAYYFQQIVPQSSFHETAFSHIMNVKNRKDNRIFRTRFLKLPSTFQIREVLCQNCFFPFL